MNILKTIQEISDIFMLNTGHSIKCITFGEHTYINLIAELAIHGINVGNTNEITINTASGPVLIKKGV